MDFEPAIPIFRIFDEAKAREFYVGFLGFAVDWEHRFEPDTPLYMQVSRGGLRIHLSEHHGDGTPGSAIYVHMDDIAGFHRELIDKRYKYYRPGLEEQPWGALTVTVQDPFGNKLTFAEHIRAAEGED
jgi:catechol 2,3-dioxygenase-like lactoylglutathione lyase family enzyme